MEGNSLPPLVGVVHHFCPLSTMWCDLMELVKEDGDVIDIAEMNWIESMTHRKGEHDWEDCNVVILKGGVGFRNVIGKGKVCSSWETLAPSASRVESMMVSMTGDDATRW